MFKSNPFAGITPFRGSNGSVPAIGGVPTLQAAIAAVERAEAQLEVARSQAKGAARREGRGVRNLFSEGKFVARSSAEKWVDQARAEGWRDGHAFLSDALDRANRPPDPADPFYHLHLRLKRHEAEGVTPADLARLRDKMESRGAFAAMRAGDHQRAAEICTEIRREEEAGHVTGAAILKAAKDRRMGGPPVPEPPQGSFAERVRLAAKKAKSPTGSDE